MKRQKRSILDRVRVVNPCNEDWNAMQGNDEVRFCSHCRKSVHNLSQMTRRDAERLVAKSNGRLCVRYISRADENVITASEFLPLHRIARRASRLAASAFTAALALTTAAAQNVNTSNQLTVEVEAVPNKEHAPQIPGGSSTLAGTIADPMGAVVPGANITLTDSSGAIRTVQTNDEGYYRIENLPNGVFTLVVEREGFTTTQVESIALSVSEQKTIEATLGIGQTEVTVGIVGVSSVAEPLIYHSAERKVLGDEDYEQDEKLFDSFNTLISDDLGQIKTLMKSGFDPNTRWIEGATPLMIINNPKVARSLIKAGGDVWARNNYGETALMSVARNAEVVKVLLRAGADVHARSEFGVTPLMYATLADDVATVRLMIDAGAGVSARDRDGRTALMFAAMEGRAETVKELLEAGAEKDARDRDGKSALSFAREFNQEETIKALEAAGARD